MSKPPEPETGSGEHRVTFYVPAGHPSLAGHFPGHPLVPGVLLLDRVLDAVAVQSPASGSDIPLALSQVKFLAPMQPGVAAEAILTRSRERLGFRVEQEGRVLAQGLFA